MGRLLATAGSRLRLNSHPGTLFLTLTVMIKPVEAVQQENNLLYSGQHEFIVGQSDFSEGRPNFKQCCSGLLVFV